jgi:hypothetical protein
MFLIKMIVEILLSPKYTTDKNAKEYNEKCKCN